MKSFLKITFALSLLLFFSECTSDKKEKKVVKKTSVKQVEEVIDTIKPSIENQEKEEDCIFDQETQNDDFLKGISELKGYVWNQEKRTATLKISEKETLKIFRGGCDHFSLSATFLVPKEITFQKNEKYFLSRILWISKLIYHKTEFEAIDIVIKENKYSVDKSNPENIHINFLNKEVYNSFTAFYNAENKDYNTFSIEYFLN